MSFDRESAIASLEDREGSSEQEQDVSADERSPESGESAEQAQAQEIKELLDLDKVDKFRMDGKEWSLNDLKKSMLMHSDYTKKTQYLSEQRKAFDQEKGFYSNLASDLIAVSKNPNLYKEFLQVYPKEFHSLVEQLTPRDQNQQQQDLQQLPPEWANKLSEMENTLNSWKSAQMETAIQAEESQLAARAERMLSKYQYANETEVLSFADAMRNNKAKMGLDPELNEKEWEHLWKASHEHVNKLVTGMQSERIQKQREANKRGKDGGAGGGIPGAEPKQHKTLKEAAEALKQSLGIN